MVKPKATIVYEAREMHVDVHLHVFDRDQHRLIGSVGETSSCDMQVGILPYPNIQSNNDEAHIWHGYMDMHQVGKSRSQKVSFNSDRFQTDNIANFLTKSAVNEEIADNKSRMDSLSNRLLSLKGASESHPEIPLMTRDVRPLLKRDLSPSEITGMTKPKALAFAKRILTVNLLNFTSQELKEHFQSDVPSSKHPVPIRLEDRVTIFGIVIGLAMTSAVKTAKHLYCLEQAYNELLSAVARTCEPKKSGSKRAQQCSMHISSDAIEVEREEESKLLSDVLRSLTNESGPEVTPPL